MYIHTLCVINILVHLSNKVYMVVLQSDFSIYVGAAPPTEISAAEYQTKKVHKDI